MLVGIIAGVGFLPLILRAVAGGAVFGGVIYGALVLLRRFVPDLFAQQAPEEGETGTAVNIVLPGEAPEAAEMDSGSDDGALEEMPSATDEEASLAQHEESPMAPEPSASERIATAAPAPAAPDGEDYSYANESLLDDGGSDAVDPRASARPAPARSSGSFDDIDVLPDLESLSDGFGAVSSDSGGGSESYEEPEPRRREGGGGGKSDPAVLAQAVRTLLKRDQER
jgi:hypothetical protein